MKLLDSQTELEVKIGDWIKDFRGDEVQVLGYYQRPAPSTGRVIVKDKFGEHEYYPGVIGCKIVE